MTKINTIKIPTATRKKHLAGWGGFKIGFYNSLIGEAGYSIGMCRTYIDDQIWGINNQVVRIEHRNQAVYKNDRGFATLVASNMTRDSMPVNYSDILLEHYMKANRTRNTAMDICDSHVRRDLCELLVMSVFSKEMLDKRMKKINYLFRHLGMGESTLIETNVKNHYIVQGDVKWQEEIWKMSFYTYALKKVFATATDVRYDKQYYWTIIAMKERFAVTNHERYTPTRAANHSVTGFVALAEGRNTHNPHFKQWMKYKYRTAEEQAVCDKYDPIKDKYGFDTQCRGKTIKKHEEHYKIRRGGKSKLVWELSTQDSMELELKQREAQREQRRQKQRMKVAKDATDKLNMKIQSAHSYAKQGYLMYEQQQAVADKRMAVLEKAKDTAVDVPFVPFVDFDMELAKAEKLAWDRKINNDALLMNMGEGVGFWHEQLNELDKLVRKGKGTVHPPIGTNPCADIVLHGRKANFVTTDGLDKETDFLTAGSDDIDYQGAD